MLFFLGPEDYTGKKNQNHMVIKKTTKIELKAHMQSGI